MPRLTPAVALIAALQILPDPASAACSASESAEGIAASATRSGSGSAARRSSPGVSRASCLVTGGALAPTTLVVDVRDQATRARLRINEATVVELADLPGWDGPTTEVALVGSGLNQSELLAQCDQLRRRGVQAVVVDGGVQTLPAARLQNASALDAAIVDAESVINALRAENAALLVAFSAEPLPAGSVVVDQQPNSASIRDLAQRPGPQILVGDRPTAERWWSALRGAGATRVFIYVGSVDALRSASAQLDSVHQGRYWVAPTPCERQG